jgi:hypothetical protein
MPLYYPVLNRRSQYREGRRYTDYRSEICEDCQHRCVYCDAHENVLGGYESMQLDHFYPQSLFPDRRHDPQNLLWVCNRCNCLKRDDWHEIDPTQLDTTKVGYLDPFAVDRARYFLVEDSGSLTSISGPAEYMIRRLKLNRSFLIHVRRSRRLIHEFTERVESYFDQLIAEHQILLSHGVINPAEFNRRVDRENSMRQMFLEIINSMPSS